MLLDEGREPFRLALCPEQQAPAGVDAVGFAVRPQNDVVAAQTDNVPVGQPGVHHEVLAHVRVFLHVVDGHRLGAVDPVGHDGRLSLVIDDAKPRDRHVGQRVQCTGEDFHLGLNVAAGPFDVVEGAGLLVFEQASLVAALGAAHRLQHGVPVLLRLRF